MKKILSLILAGLMTVSCAAFVAADDAAVEATSDPAQDYAISFLETLGIYKGGEGLTNEDDIQRYQMALFVSRISTGWVEDKTWEDGTANDSKFDDINDEPANKYLGALSYANQNGIIEGYSATKFAPYDNITYRDALTMVVRTLGYKGLSYPWGNIEKAVELGLTEGVDAAYTDVLTRGEVAVIIYNALFADTAKGGTLAKTIFGYDFAWQNIIVVSTDEYSLVSDKDGKKQYAPAEYVGFKTVDADGTLGDKVWLVKSAELGLTGHEEEQAVGSIFVALFEKVDDKYVTILDADSAIIKKTVQNIGITDNEGLAVTTQPIAAELANYKQVKNYTDGVVSYTYEDLRILGYTTVDVVDIDGNAELVGIDYTTNNILFYNEKEAEWEIEWFYNEDLNKYYQYLVDSTNSKKDSDGDVYTVLADGIVYINWMSEADFNKWYADIIKEVVGSYNELKLDDVVSIDGKAPYAKLDMYDLDSNYYVDAEVAIYKDYKLGIFATSSKKCGINADSINHNNDTKHPTYKITELDGDKVVYEQFVEEGHVAHENEIGAQFAWLTVDPSVTTFDPAVGGVVLYNVNATTGEIEIVKHITTGENDDADSKVFTGVLQAYSTKNKTVTIDGTTYNFDYAGLIDTFDMANTEVATRKLVAAELDKQYMQYVTVTLCDNVVVDVDLRGAESDFIVSLGYAGVTADGYIAVYGYKTTDLKLSVYKINSYNGWKKGDYRYYPENADKDSAFAYGALYEIRSYDAESNSYGVYTENVSSVLEGSTPVIITFDNGYRVVQPAVVKQAVREYEDEDGDEFVDTYYYLEAKKDDAGKVVAPSIYKMTDADKYIFVDENGNWANSIIHVFEGKADESYHFEGMLVEGKADSKTMILYSRFDGYKKADGQWVDSNWKFNENSYDIGFVLYDGGATLDAAFDDAVVENVELLGATVSEVPVLNLLTGAYDQVIASNNIDLVAGHIYRTIGNQIMWDITDYCANIGHDIFALINDAYSSKDIDYADYITGRFTLKTSELTKKVDGKDVDLTDLVLATKMGLVSGTNEDVKKAIADEVIDDIKIYLVSEDDSFKWYYNHGTVALTEKKFSELNAAATYTVRAVYEVATENIVLYIYDNENDIYVPEVETPAPSDNYTDTVYTRAYPTNIDDTRFDLAATYDVTATFDNADCQGEPQSLKLNSLKLEIVEAEKVLNEGKEDDKNDDKYEWVRTSLKDCDVDGALHNALAKVGLAFGGDYFDKNDASIDATESTSHAMKVNVTPSALDCGLVNEVAVSFTDTVLNTNGLVLWMYKSTTIELQVGNITVSLTLTPDLIIEGEDNTNTIVDIDVKINSVEIAEEDIDLNKPAAVETPAVGAGDVIILG